MLYIKANAKPENQSRIFQLSDRFITVYKETHPGDAVITLDLYKVTITAEGLDIVGQDVKAILEETLEKAGIIAKNF